MVEICKKNCSSAALEERDPNSGPYCKEDPDLNFEIRSETNLIRTKQLKINKIPDSKFF